MAKEGFIAVNYVEDILEDVNGAYKNFVKSYKKFFILPEEVLGFFKDNKTIRDKQTLENYTITLEQNFSNISCIVGKENFAIFLNHHFYLIRNSLINIKSIDANLTEQKFETDVIRNSSAMDIVALTAVHMLGANLSQLRDTYNKLEMFNEPNGVYLKLLELINKTLELDGEKAFKTLLDNIANYLQNYNTIYKTISELPEDGWSPVRIEMFMYCTDAYFLLGIIYKILLQTPLNNKIIDSKMFKRLVPELDAFSTI
ncbi:hypothetical protein SSABA_v1c01720 [Spiroplasma sabaudiense Ar-1343]|uniref:Uncharacterized protein n=1 Tax=Spiroplasma sabaudiense Ar-1343 TaxID=1276257 RepID=W6AIQ2_9MOLU|nr:hypothetical protein [Spiroplasma sabaudiense]AHI53584.1 hypothetical protein SSABA_v1c01720 [Spiroplasma sabaudiense Ar-1343]